MVLRPARVWTSSPIRSSCTRRSPEGDEILVPFKKQLFGVGLGAGVGAGLGACTLRGLTPLGPIGKQVGRLGPRPGPAFPPGAQGPGAGERRNGERFSVRTLLWTAQGGPQETRRKGRKGPAGGPRTA
jgi:hypothetical protein